MKITVDSTAEGKNGADYFFDNVSWAEKLSSDQPTHFYLATLNQFPFLISFFHFRPRGFVQIMQTTSTYISWPCRLKIGAKTKKGKIECGRRCLQNHLLNDVFHISDPHVRIYGRPDDVLKAKERVLTALDSRVIL